ncbi:MAG: T9SS type A sorting domain-containing protein [Flavobacteriales bacterium]|nr:T9SS type A sorting domain-containing protein [Flavobacteriales bacterium]
MNRRITLVPALLFSLMTAAQEGPGGVQGDTENRFWFSADVLYTIDEEELISQWKNFGGNTLSAYEVGGRQPMVVYENDYALNGYPTIQFDGNNDRLKIDNNADINNFASDEPVAQRSYYIVFTTGEETEDRMVVYEEGGEDRGFNIWIEEDELFVGTYNISDDGEGSEWEYTYVSDEVDQEEAYIISVHIDGDEDADGTMDVYMNGGLLDTAEGVGLRYPSEGNVCLGAMNGDSYFIDEEENGQRFEFEGQIAEFILYNQMHGLAQRNIIENYLSAKFDIPLDGNDYYNGDHPTWGNHDHHVIGIGSQGGVSNLVAQGSGIVRMSNPSDLGINEYLFLGYSDLKFGWRGSDLPNNIAGRSSGSWVFDEVGGNVGATTLTFNLSDYMPNNAVDFRLIADIDGDGDYADETPLNIIPATSDGVRYTFSGVDIPEGIDFTIGFAMLFLPVEFTDFTASPVSGDVNLNWSTASETNNQLFKIERSTNAVDWEAIAYIDGAGNSQSLINYNYTDTHALNGTSYYRIRQMDFSGASSLSMVRSVYITDDSSLWGLYPNPGNQVVTVYNDGSTKMQLEVFDLYGHHIKRIQIREGERKSLNVSDWAAGVYIVTTENNDKEFVRFVKR